MSTKATRASLQNNELFQTRASIWNDRLVSGLEDSGLTQDEFSKMLNARFDPETPYSQKTVSQWCHVGESGMFPRYEVMIHIADLLGVDVGYLTGETEYRTFRAEKVARFTGLSEGAVDAVRDITYFRRKYDLVDDEESGALLSRLLSSKGIPHLLDCLSDLAGVSKRARKLWESVEEEFGTDTAALAFEHLNDFVTVNREADPEGAEEADGHNEKVLLELGLRSEKEQERFARAVRTANEVVDKARELKDADGACRYRLIAAFSDIVDELYPPVG